jgi:hypothetical protein
MRATIRLSMTAAITASLVSMSSSASSPLAGNVNLDPTSLPASDAIAGLLMGSCR